MTNTPGWVSPGSADSPEPEDGDGSDPSASPLDPATEPPGQDSQEPPPTGWAQHQPPPSAGWADWAPPGGQPPSPSYSQYPQYPGASSGPAGGPRWGTPPPPGAWGRPGPWGKPPAAKPGVIPLRPLGVGEIIDGSLATLRRHWRATVGFTAAIALVTQSVGVAIQGAFVDDARIDDLRDNPDPSVHDILHALSGAYAGLGLTVLVIMIGTLIATAMLTTVCSRAVLGRSVTAAEAWQDARPRLAQLVGLALLLVLINVGILALGALPGVLVALAGARAGGAALATLGVLGGLVAVIWLWIQWCLAPPALMLEKQGILAAMKRSARLIRGSWWRALGVQLLGVALIYIATYVIEMPFMLLGAAITGDGLRTLMSPEGDVSWSSLVFAGIGAAVAATITLPISAGVTSLLYMDQRIRRESLDIELLRAAGKG